MFVSYHLWLLQADRDLKSAESAFFDGDERSCSLIARQASEKALWAYYIKLTGNLPSGSHGVTELVEFLKLDELKELMDKSSAEYAAAQLKPAERSLKLAKKIIEWVEWKLQ